MTNELPHRLKKDALVEVLFEVQFTHAAIPELVLGNLIATANGLLGPKALTERLPLADIPVPIRKADPALAQQATMQVKNLSGTRIARIGEATASWHTINAYPGWEAFRGELETFVGKVYSVMEGQLVTRLGLRYLNFLNSKDHLVRGISDLTIDVTIGNAVLNQPLNVQYQRSVPIGTLAVRVATPEYVQPERQDFSLLIDLDVFSVQPRELNQEDALAWAESAHNSIKVQFFTLLKDEIIQSLMEKP